MVHSPMYHRLMRFVEDAKANESLSDYDSKHKATLEAMKEAEEYIQHFREYQGFQGQTGDAIDKWLEDAERRVRLWRASYLATSQVEVEMRRVMQHAREEAEMLSPVLVDARLDKLRDVAEVTIPVMEQYGLVGMAYNAVASTGAAVYDAVAAQANNQREASSTDILQRLNDSMQGLANHAARIKEMQEELLKQKGKWNPGDLPRPSDPSVVDQLEQGRKGVSPHDPGVYPGNRDTDYGRSDLRDPNSGAYPNGFNDPNAQETDAEKLRRLQSQRIPDKFNKDGELGSRSNPITDPEDLKDIDLLHSRIGGERYANGLTRGGYTPAPPNDRHHPLWNINGGPSTRFDTSGRTSLAGAGALGAGVLGAGALGAAALGARGGSGLGAGSLGALGRSGAGGLGASGRGGLGAGGLGGLRGGSASVGGLGSGGLPGSASASGGTTGLTGTNGAGAAGAAGKTGAGSTSGGSGAAGRPGMGGFMGAGAGAGGGKDDKKGKRRKYTAFKFEDDEDDALPPGYVNPMSQTYGSDKDLKPASQKDDGWDPRQW
ncbi:MAG: hypothetical protein KH413_04160 [Actinomyces sp.]|nr:hypothetical protein [Actinomyces sp.]